MGPEQDKADVEAMDVEDKVNEKQAVEAFNPDLLRIYYDRLFPYDQMIRWLSYGKGSSFLIRREFSFTLENDAYIRFKSFKDLDDMKRQMRDMQPRKIDIGAVYNVAPEDRDTVNSAAFKPLERELVFDVDLTDYDDVRTCCGGAKICEKCWTFMTAAIKVVDVALREDFGFQHILWVYSGRRGVHCWVADKAARELANDGRSAVVQYLSVDTGNDNTKKKVSLPLPLHPSLKRAFEILEPMFADAIASSEGQGIFCDEEHWSKVLALLPEDVSTALQREWSSPDCISSGAEKWIQLKNTVQECKESQVAKKSKKNDGNARSAMRELERCIPEVVLSYLYPRLDVNVSKGLNHLLKSPFAVHPATGRVCVPINPSEAETFSPLDVPTLGSMVQDLDHFKGHDENLPDNMKTGMKNSLQLMDRFLKGLQSECSKERRDERESLNYKRSLLDDPLEVLIPSIGNHSQVA